MAPINLTLITCKSYQKWAESFHHAPFQVLQRRNKFVVNIYTIMSPVSLAFPGVVPVAEPQMYM